MRQILFTLFGYRFIYIGMSTRNPGRLKIGTARNVKLRWKAIDRSMPGKQFPVFGLPCFNALWFEGHLHRVMGRFRKPVAGDGGSEFFTYTNPFSWPGWIYVICAITWAFLVTHFILYGILSGVWCWYADVAFLDFQKGVLNAIITWFSFNP